MSDSTITIAMASFPPRRTGMIRVVSELLPQCDRLCLYLNNYDAVPAELPKSEKLEVILAGAGREFPDKGSQGKLHWIGLCAGYYLTVDDDIFYPPDYASSIVAGIEKYGRKAIVGYHGSVFKLANGVPTPLPRFMRDHRTLYMYTRGERADIPVHMIGNGTMGCHPRTLGLSYDTVCCGELHSGDDEDVAIWAQSHGVCLIRLAGKTNWLRPDMTAASASPLHSRTEFMTKADAKLRSCRKWRLNPVDGEDRISVNNTISRNTNLVNARSVVHRHPSRPSRPSVVNLADNKPNARIINRNVTTTQRVSGNMKSLDALIVRPTVRIGKKVAKDGVVISMATFPRRKAGMLNVVNALLPQCDKMYIYMNGYTAIPDELPKSEKIHAILAGPGSMFPDIGSHGKLYFAGVDDGYFLTVDDDIVYPTDYVEKMTKCVDSYNGRAIVGVNGFVWHTVNGTIVNQPDGSTVNFSKNCPFTAGSDKDVSMHVCGCGTLCVRAKDIGLTNSVCTGDVNSGDDADVAIWAQKNGIPVIRIKSVAGWLGCQKAISEINALHLNQRARSAEHAKFRNYKKWKLNVPSQKERTITIGINGFMPKDLGRMAEVNTATTVMLNRINEGKINIVSVNYKDDVIALPDSIRVARTLVRDPAVDIPGARHIPYLHDVLDEVCNSGSDIIGYVNSDILIPKTAIVTLLESNVDMICMQRTDIKSCSVSDFEAGNFTVTNPKHGGVDGVFFTREFWLRNSSLFPRDLIIGEPGWDNVYKLIAEKKVNSFIVRGLYHVTHKELWRNISPGGARNLAIFEKIKAQLA